MKTIQRGILSAAVSAFACLAVAQQTTASVVVFNSQQGYDLVAPTFGISTLDYELDSYSGVYTSISGGQNDTAWEIDATSGVEGTFGEWVSSVGQGESLNIEFFSDSVYSVGGIFHVLNAQNESADSF